MNLILNFIFSNLDVSVSLSFTPSFGFLFSAVQLCGAVPRALREQVGLLYQRRDFAAEIRGQSLEELAAQTTKNARTVYNLK